MFLEFVQFGAAGGHGQYFCADESSATDVVRRVADHDDFLAAQLPAQHAAAALERGHGNVIAILMSSAKAPVSKTSQRP